MIKEKIQSDISWEEWLIDEDRKIANSDRRYRYHNRSYDAMGEKLVSQESITKYIPIEEIISETSGFLESITHLHLHNAIKKLNSKQRLIIEMVFWQGYTQQETAKILHCSQANVSKVLKRAITQLIKEYI